MTQRSRYNELPYACHPVRVAHLDNLACKAKLYGLAPAPIERCRVLEIGCGNGTNLLSLAQIYPDSTFVGIDHAQRQIEQGRAIVNAIGSQNVELRAMAVSDFNQSTNKFDYILCHGVYSWVTSDVAQQILRTVRSNLSPGGVAYVSYNIYPGWHLRSVVRELLCRQTARTSDPITRVQQARQYLDFLIKHAPGSDSAYLAILKREKDILDKTPDAYVYHEHLSEENHPLYFHQFVDRAASCGLQYVCEASFNPDEAMFSDELRAHLHQLASNRTEYEQQVDILCNGTFRKSLLCHCEAAVSSQPSAAVVKSFQMRSTAQPQKPIADWRSHETATFRGARGETITTPQPLLKVSLAALAEAWPHALGFEAVFRRGHELLQVDSSPTAGEGLSTNQPSASTATFNHEALAAAMLRCHRLGVVEFHSRAPHVVTTIPPRPQASALARWQAAHGEPVCNLTHEVIDVSALDRLVITLLNGENDTSTITSRLIEHVQRGDIVLQQQDQPVRQRDIIETVVQHTLAQTLKKLAQMNSLR